MHADASTFAEGVSKEAALQQVLDQAAALFDGQTNWVCPVPPLRFLRPRTTHLWMAGTGSSELLSSLGMPGLEDEEEDEVLTLQAGCVSFGQAAVSTATHPLGSSDVTAVLAVTERGRERVRVYESGGESLTWDVVFRPRRNLANTASLLWHAYKSLPPPSKEVNWAGMFNASLSSSPRL